MTPKLDSGHRFFCCFVLFWFVCLFFLAEGDISRTREPCVLLVHSVKANRPFRVPLAYVAGGIDVLGVLASLSRQLRRLVKLSILKRRKVTNISVKMSFICIRLKIIFTMVSHLASLWSRSVEATRKWPIKTPQLTSTCQAGCPSKKALMHFGTEKTTR